MTPYYWFNCGLCRIAGRIRWDRSQFKARTAEFDTARAAIAKLETR